MVALFALNETYTMDDETTKVDGADMPEMPAEEMPATEEAMPADDAAAM